MRLRCMYCSWLYFSWTRLRTGQHMTWLCFLLTFKLVHVTLKRKYISNMCYLNANIITIVSFHLKFLRQIPVRTVKTTHNNSFWHTYSHLSLNTVLVCSFDIWLSCKYILLMSVRQAVNLRKKIYSLSLNLRDIFKGSLMSRYSYGRNYRLLDV